jgi:hypothetical protein
VVAVAGVLAVVMALAVACTPPPGAGRIRLSGVVNGSASGGTAECFGPGENGDHYGLWTWSGEVDGHVIDVNAADLGTMKAATLFVDDTDFYGAADTSEGWSFSVEDGVARLHALTVPLGNQTGPGIDVTLTLTCPAT